MKVQALAVAILVAVGITSSPLANAKGGGGGRGGGFSSASHSTSSSRSYSSVRSSTSANAVRKPSGQIANPTRPLNPSYRSSSSGDKCKQERYKDTKECEVSVKSNKEDSK